MYSKLNFTLNKLITAYTTFIGVNCVLANSNSSRREVYYIPKWSHKKAQFCTGIMTATTFFCILRTLERYFSGDPSLPICYILTLVLTLLNTSMMILFYNITTVVSLCCQVHNYSQDFKEAWLINYNYRKAPTGFKLDLFLIILIIWFVFLLPVAFIIFIFVFFDLPFFPHTVLPFRVQDSPALYFLFITFYSYLVVAFTATALQQVVLVISYFGAVVPLLQKEFKGGLIPKSYCTRNELRHPYNLSRQYTSVECLHKHSMSIFGIITILIQTLTVQFVLYCNYTLLRTWNELELIMKVLIIMMTFDMTTFWSLTLEVCGRFYLNSTRLLKSWKLLPFPSKKEAKFMSKFKKRCRPLTIGMEGYRKIRRLSVLKFISSLVQVTVRALLAL